MKDLLIASIIHRLVQDYGAAEICRFLAIQATNYYERELAEGEECPGSDFGIGCRKLWEAVSLFRLENRVQETNRNLKEIKRHGRIS